MRWWWALRDSMFSAFVTVLVLPLLRGYAALVRRRLRDLGVGAARGVVQWSRSGRLARPGGAGERDSEAWLFARGAGPWPSGARLATWSYLAASLERAARAWVWTRVTYWGCYVASRSRAHPLTLRRYCRHHLAVRDASLVITAADSPASDRIVEPGSPLDAELAPYDLTIPPALVNRLCIAGELRSGPSRLLERLFWHACELAARDPRQARLPVLLDLARIEVPETVSDHELGAWLYRQVRAEAEGSRVYRLRSCFDACARRAGLLVLLDGLGDVSAGQHPRMRAAIARLGRGLARMSRDNALVVTVRASSHAETASVDPDSLGMFPWIAVGERAPDHHRPGGVAAHADVGSGLSRPGLDPPPAGAPPLSWS